MVSEKFVEMKIFSENVALFSMKLLVTTCWFLIEEFTAVKATAVELFDPDEIIEKELSYFLSSSSLQDIDYITFEWLGPFYYQVGEYITTNPCKRGVGVKKLFRQNRPVRRCVFL